MVEDFIDKAVGGHFSQAVFRANDEPMVEHGMGELLHIVGQDEIETIDGGQRLRGMKQRQ